MDTVLAEDTHTGSTDADLVDRGRRLFTFLAEAQKLKGARVCKTSDYDGVFWLENLPDHPAVFSAHRTEPEPEDAILTVDRPVAPQWPEPPAQLVPWLDTDKRDPQRVPKLLPWIRPGLQRTDDEGADRTHLTERPDVQGAYDAWIPAWSDWAEQETRDRPVVDLYNALFAAHVKVTGQAEDLEVVVGMALLAWSPTGQQDISRHVLTSDASLEFDEETGAIRVMPQPAVDVLNLELDMVDAASLPQANAVNEIRTAAREFDQHPLARAEVGALARRFMYMLAPEATYSDDDVRPRPGATPRAAFAPAVIVRKRSPLGLVKVFNTIADTISETKSVPSGLLPLVNPDHEPIVSQDSTPGAVVEVDGPEDVVLPLPLNSVQLDIIRRVDRNPQTLVQGPPGTGKTHTAAALLTHLLAQGKRVLVTAHTDRALHEVRAKMPKDIQPLAVSVLGADRSDLADLKVAVGKLSAAAADHDEDAARETIARCEQRLDELRRERADLRGQLLAARVREIDVHEHAGYNGTLAAIAQAYEAAVPIYGWISQYVECPTGSAPLSDEAAMRWLRLLCDVDLASDEAEAAQQLPDLDDLVAPDQFGRLVDGAATSEAGAARHADLVQHDDFAAVAAMPAEARTALRERMHDLARRASELEQRDESWTNAALRDIRGGRGATWMSRAKYVGDLIHAARPALDALGPATQVSIASHVDPGVIDALARNLLAHVRASGPLKTNPDGSVKVGAFAPKSVKMSAPLFDSVRVNRQIPSNAEQLGACLAHLDAEHKLGLLDQAWPQDVHIPPEDTLHERLQWHQTELEQLNRLLALGHELAAEDHRLAQAGLRRPDWNDVASVLTHARLVDAAAAHEAVASATNPLEKLAEVTQRVVSWSNAAPAAHRMHEAVAGRDRDAYAAAHVRIARLHGVRALARERDDLTASARTAVPELAEAVRADPADSKWTERLSAFSAAWDWAVTGNWILAQDSTDTNVLQAKVAHIDEQLRVQVERLATTRAWASASSPTRLTKSARADLTHYAQLVKSLGKGTGKYAVKRRAEIRTAMANCRPAVPVWILPIYRIAEQLTVSENMFDVVIVDEASQAGLEAAFLQYLAPRVVVIGDDKQVSPAAVGVDQQQLRDLAQQYLYDDRYRASWVNPKRSYFDEANMRFGKKITLVEHRRCVPEIIGFSNRIAYEPENIRLIPVRQYGANRLEPIKAVHITTGYETGSKAKINRPEVEAIVAQIQTCLNDPRYDGKTFGVISLQGTAQARAIEAALLQALPAETWAARDLRCGDAPDFQGSERDVMFLSMVAAPDESRRLGSLTQDMYVQRYNVAVSRAKDQVWLFHSITLDHATNSEDMRHQLLDYCYGVIQRGESGESAGSEPVPDDRRVDPFESLFEQRVYNKLVDRGFAVTPQYDAVGYRLDLVITGASRRLAIECDGDAWHGPDRYEADMARQRDLERCGWEFFRIRESAWYVDPSAVMAKLAEKLEELEIRPSGWAEPEHPALHSEDAASDFTKPSFSDGAEAGDSALRIAESAAHVDEVANPAANGRVTTVPAGSAVTRPGVTKLTLAGPDDDSAGDETTAVQAAAPVTPTRASGGPPVAVGDAPPSRYNEFEGTTASVVDTDQEALIDGLRAIVEVEGPVVGHRLRRRYVASSGGLRVGKQIGATLDQALREAVRRGVFVADQPLSERLIADRTYRLPDQPAAVVREVGPRSFEEMPPLELVHIAAQAATDVGWDDEEALQREVLRRVGISRLTKGLVATICPIIALARPTNAPDTGDDERAGFRLEG